METLTTSKRVLNFAAGPAILPMPVLEEAQRNLLELPGVGMSILEISHRSKPFEAIIQQTEQDIRELAGMPDGYQVLFLQGGASTQFSMLPMNMLASGATADYLVTGAWGQKAVKEARRHGVVNVSTTETTNFTRLPGPGEITLTDGAAYVHFTSNETIHGVQWKREPEVGGAPLVCDTSSDMFCRPIDLSKYAVVYAGAQKNLGPAGVTIVIVRDDMLQRSPDSLPTMLNYNTHAKEKSLYNTPPVFSIYIVGLVMQWLKANGGLAAAEQRNERKAAALYAEIDRTGFYRGHAAKDCRSVMNVTFRLPSEELEKEFARQATAAGLDGLKGHRSVGGLRASIYNAFPEEGVETLVEFMREFERSRG
jgi:phosphoserine aminotransferase